MTLRRKMDLAANFEKLIHSIQIICAHSRLLMRLSSSWWIRNMRWTRWRSRLLWIKTNSRPSRCNQWLRCPTSARCRASTRRRKGRHQRSWQVSSLKELQDKIQAVVASLNLQERLNKAHKLLLNLLQQSKAHLSSATWTIWERSTTRCARRIACWSVRSKANSSSCLSWPPLEAICHW